MSPHPLPSQQGVAAQTYLQYGTYEEEPIMDVGVPDFLAMMPGMSMVPNQSNWMSNPFYTATESPYAQPPLPVQHHAPPPASAVSPTYSLPAPVVHPNPMSPTSAQEFYTSNISPTEPVMHHNLFGLSQGSNFRPSKHMYAQGVMDSTPRNIDFQTTQFRK